MLPRTMIAIAALGLLGTPAAPNHYRIDFKSGQTMDMSSLGQGVMNINITSTLWVAVTSRDSAGTELLHVVVDSSKMEMGDLPGGADPSMFNVPNGATIDLAVVDGKLGGLDPEKMGESPASAFVLAGIGLLYSRPPRANIKLGDSWVDTVTSDTTTAIGKGTSTQIRKWKASAQEGDALVLDSDFTGTLTMGGGMANIDATSKGTNHLTAPAKGVARAASVDSETSMTMSVPGAPAPIQMNITSAVKITPIK